MKFIIDKSQYQGELTFEWQPYSGEYEKEVQDIKLKDGRELINYYPNAGEWIPCCGRGVNVPNDKVAQVRLNLVFNQSYVKDIHQ